MIRWLFVWALACVLSTGAARGAEVILLHASKAVVHGEKLRYEPETNKICLGYWTNPADWAEWKFAVGRPGAFELEVWQGCGQGNGGSEVRVESAGQAIDFVVDETGHFQSFIPRKLGRIHFTSAGEFALSIKPKNKKAAAVMDIRQVTLTRVPVEGDTPFKSGVLNARRTVFLGDSITHSGEYIEFLEAYLRLTRPLAEMEILNLGLPSETLSGLSEPGHAGGSFPRPDLHERLDRVLEKAKPDLIVACYGMNDGIYHPFSEGRFAKFREGILKLRAKANAAGARVIHLTPAAFDAVPLKGRTLPDGLEEYRQPFEGYDQALGRYAEWLLSQRTNGWMVVDVHGAMNRYLAAQRESNPQFTLAGDGVHPTRQGHWVIAAELIGLNGAAFLHAYPSPALFDSFPKGAAGLKLLQERQRLLKDAWLNHVGHLRPGMGKGKPLDEATAAAAALGQRIASLFDPQFPGPRALWNGYEACRFEWNGQPLRVVLPRVGDALAAWHSVEDLERDPLANLRAVGRGLHLIEGAENAVAEFAPELEGKYGWRDRASNDHVRHRLGLLASAPAGAFSLQDVNLDEYARQGPRDELGRPLIRKLGTVDMDLVEATPVVVSNRLWRLEWVREGYWDNARKTNYFRFRDPKSGEVTAGFADGHEFGSAFVHDGTVYVTGTLGRGQVNIFASRDLATWEKAVAIPGGKYGIFNTSICRAGDEFVLMFEIDKPAAEAGAAFTARFAKSRDLRAWTVTPPECAYAKDRYTAPHALRWLDGWFYNFYLEAHDGYEMRVVRSRDLIQWQPSPLNPVLKASADDRRIAGVKMANNHRARVANAVNLNNSDIDFCELNGRLHLTYSWGNQQGMEHLAVATYDGPEAEFLRGWFPGD